MMKCIKGKLLKILIVIFAIIISVCVFAYIKTFQYDCVMPGISIEQAEEITANNKNAHIVRCVYTSGLDYKVLDEDNNWIGVDIAGWSNSGFTLSRTLATDGNQFLIYGDMEPIDSLEKENDPTLWGTFYSIYVEECTLIYPIMREYTFRLKGRLFYPKKYIDQFDVDNKDFVYLEPKTDS